MRISSLTVFDVDSIVISVFSMDINNIITTYIDNEYIITTYIVSKCIITTICVMDRLFRLHAWFLHAYAAWLMIPELSRRGSISPSPSHYSHTFSLHLYPSVICCLAVRTTSMVSRIRSLLTQNSTLGLKKITTVYWHCRILFIMYTEVLINHYTNYNALNWCCHLHILILVLPEK